MKTIIIPLFFLLCLIPYATYPSLNAIVNIHIDNIQQSNGLICIDGKIVINPSKLSSEWHIDRGGYAWYNYKGMLAYYEENINQILIDNGFGYVKVLQLNLRWLQIQNQGIDVIGFHIELVIQ